MLDRINLLRDYVSSVLTKHKKFDVLSKFTALIPVLQSTCMVSSAHDTTTILILLQVMKIMSQAIGVLSGDTYVTLSVVFPTYRSITERLKVWCMSIARVLLAVL